MINNGKEKMWIRKVKEYLCLIALSFIWVYLVPAQGQRKESKEDQDVVKLQSMLVQVPVIVSDKGGRYITDLKARDFQIFEDGVEQQISFFGSIEEPFNVALVLDSSGSTAAQLDAIKQAALVFIERLRPFDRVTVINFNDSVQINCELTGDRDILRRAVRAIRPGEYTQVFEAVYTAVWERLSGIKGRKAVILFTDGIDTASSEIDEEDTINAVIESEDVIIYPIRYGTRKEVEQKSLLSGKYSTSQIPEIKRDLDNIYSLADEYLQKLADYSGGVLERADELDNLERVFTKIANELRRQYLIGYYPSNTTTSDNKRSIFVRAKKEGAKVRSRPEYSLR